MIDGKAIALLVSLAAPWFLTGATFCRSTAEVERFLESSSPDTARIALTGTVLRTYGEQMDIGDRFGQLSLYDTEKARQPHAPGDILAIRGYANVADDREPSAVSCRTSLLGRGSVPPPLSLPIGDLNASHHLKDVCTTGTVVDAFMDDLDPRYSFFILKDGLQELPVAVEGAP